MKNNPDRFILLGLLVLALVTRIPFRSQFLYHWDSVNFALSLEHYDVRLHQPHPPGYFLYSMLGKVVNSVVHEANTSLVLISLLGGALGILAIYWLGLRLFNRKVALIAALLALTSPMHWFQSEVALSYALEFLLVTLVAGLCYLITQGERNHWPLLAILLGVAGGIRQNDLVFLLPLFLYTLYYLSWRQRIFSLALLGLVVLAWFIPMVTLSGNLPGYLAALNSASDEIVSQSTLYDFTEFLTNASRMVVFVGYGLLLGELFLIWGAYRLIRHGRDVLRDRRTWVITLWMLPSVFFYIFIHLRQPGHIFTFLPALLLITAFLIVDAAQWLSARLKFLSPLYGLTTAVLVVNILFFLFAPAQLLGSNRLTLQTPGWQSIHQRDEYLGERLPAIRTHFDPQTTVVLGGDYYFRHVDYYLRNYQITSLSYDLNEEIELLPANVHTVVFLEPIYPAEVLNRLPHESIALPDGQELGYVHWEDDTRAYLSVDSFELVKP